MGLDDPVDAWMMVAGMWWWDAPVSFAVKKPGDVASWERPEGSRWVTGGWLKKHIYIWDHPWSECTNLHIPIYTTDTSLLRIRVDWVVGELRNWGNPLSEGWCSKIGNSWLLSPKNSAIRQGDVFNTSQENTAVENRGLTGWFWQGNWLGWTFYSIMQYIHVYTVTAPLLVVLMFNNTTTNRIWTPHILFILFLAS